MRKQLSTQTLGTILIVEGILLVIAQLFIIPLLTK
jgi:hypothetical protein